MRSFGADSNVCSRVDMKLGNQRYQITTSFSDDPKEIIHKMFAGVDISLVDPQLFPLITPVLQQYLEKATADNDTYLIKEIEFYLRYIDYQPRREELTRILKKPTPPPVVIDPVMKPEKVKSDVEYIMKTGKFPKYTIEENDLVVKGLREKRAYYISKGDYLKAERAESLSRQLFNNGQLSTVETLQRSKVNDLRQKLNDATRELEENKKKWEQLYQQMRQTANEEFSELERQHNEQIQALENLFNQEPPPFIKKYSAELLNLEKRKQSMLSIKLYAQASQMQEQIDDLQEKEDDLQIQRWHNHINSRIKQTKAEQARQLENRKAFWKETEKQMVKEANKDIDQATKAIDHMKKSLQSNVCARKMTTTMKKDIKTKTAMKGTLPDLSTPRRELLANTERRQRQILNHKIYTITNRTTPIKSPAQTPKRPLTSFV